MRVLQVFGSIVENIDGEDCLGWNTLKRCEEALKLLETESFDLLLLSGGSSGDMKSAALLMEEWFHSKNVDIAMIRETKSCDTWQNVIFGMERISREYPGVKMEIHTISHWMHIARVWIIYRLGYKMKVKSHCLWYSAHWKYLVKGALTLIYTLFNPTGTEEGLLGLPLKNSADRREYHRRFTEGYRSN